MNISRCGAKTRNGGTCQKYAMANGKCALHGGKTPVGPANANYRHGRYSKYLPERLRERYEAGLSDPDLLELRSEVALLDSRLTELLQKVESGESIRRWHEVHALWIDYKQAVEGRNPLAQAECLDRLNAAIDGGHSESVAWQEIMKMLEQRRKIVDSEQRRMATAQQMITVEQAVAMLNSAIAAIRESVFRYTDRETAKKIVIDASVVYQRLITVERD